MTDGPVMDIPAAWAFVETTRPEQHHERCSWRATEGALLCDCPLLWDEYERRRVARAQQQSETAEAVNG